MKDRKTVIPFLAGVLATLIVFVVVLWLSLIHISEPTRPY